MPHKLVQERFRTSVTTALAKFRETAALEHQGLKGRFREIFCVDLLGEVLSADFIAGTGLVVDHVGGTSKEADVVIFDRFNVPAVLIGGSNGYFPIEGVSYYGEVKSRLASSELNDSIQKFRHLKSLKPMPNAQRGVFFPHRFLFAWSPDLKGGDIGDELARYIAADEDSVAEPALNILCVVGKGYCCITQPEGSPRAWYKVGSADGVQEVVNFIGGVANSLIEMRLRRFGTKFGNYIIPDGKSTRIRDVPNG